MASSVDTVNASSSSTFRGDEIAFSSWCLAELVEILECRRWMNMKVVPVLYHVDPSDVGNQRGALADAFVNPEEPLALSETASIPGSVLNYSDTDWQSINESIGSLCNLSNQMPEDGSTNWDSPPRFDVTPDESDDADDDADEMVHDYIGLENESLSNLSNREAQVINNFIASPSNLSNEMLEDGSVNLDLPRFDDSQDEADNDAGEMVQDYVTDLPQEMIEKPEDSSPICDLSPRHGYPDHAAHVVQEAHVIQNHVADLSQVTTALRRDGLASINIIIGIDFSQTNEWKAQLSFDRLSLQATRYTPNPREKVISILGEVLAPFSEDNMIPCFGFGDETTKDKNVFSFHNDDSPCHGYQEVLSCYKRILPNLQFAGRTSYAPVIDAATNIVEKSCGQYHILFIITDGQAMRSVDTSDDLSAQEVQTIKSIVEASSCPLSIVLVGVGDGPWEDIQKFMKKIPAHEFDNFKFVNFTEFMSEMETPSNNETTFAAAALIDIPTQYKKAIELGMLGCVTGKAKKISPLPPPVPAVEPSNSSSSLADMETGMVCSICVTNTKGMAFIPCGHTTCVECGEILEICPFCRKTFTDRLRLF